MSTGLDKTLELEAVYYSAPIPRGLDVLTVLGTVFDRVYFPGVYFPKSGFDQKEFDGELARIEALPNHNYSTQQLLSMMRFVRYASTLDGFCVFTADRETPFDHDAPGLLVKSLYTAINGPDRPGFIPSFETGHHKSMPGGDEHITYPGDLHYMAGSIAYSAKKNIPLLNDRPGLPVPFLDGEPATNTAKMASARLAVECVRLALPELPLLRAEDLMEFRSENAAPLRAFRIGLLKYAGKLDLVLGEQPARDIEEATKFFVATEIAPALDELRTRMNAPARSWFQRGIDALGVSSKLEPAIYTMNVHTMIGSAIANLVPQFVKELKAKHDKDETIQRSPLYYLLQLERFAAKR